LLEKGKGNTFLLFFSDWFICFLVIKCSIINSLGFEFDGLK
jgi:hypothetical protein